MASSLPLPAIVVDASFVIRAVLPAEEKTGTLERFASWHQSGRDIFAPEILLPEAVSLIRRGIFNHWITEAEGQVAAEDLFRLGVEIIPSDAEICQAAPAWAGRLGHSTAYDGFYLAVAKRKDAQLWTADQRLRNRVQQLGLSWVRYANQE